MKEEGLKVLYGVVLIKVGAHKAFTLDKVGDGDGSVSERGKGQGRKWRRATLTQWHRAPPAGMRHWGPFERRQWDQSNKSRTCGLASRSRWLSCDLHECGRLEVGKLWSWVIFLRVHPNYWTEAK